MGLLDIFSFDSNFIDREVRKIAYKAKDIAEYLCLLDENYISYFEYNTAYYEELFLLCCIEAVKLINNKYDNNIYEKIKSKVLKYSNNFDGIRKYDAIKTIIDDTFKQRSMFYMSLINTYNYNLNNDFFSTVQDYQVKIFSLKYKDKPAIKEKIKSILLETIPAIKEFYYSFL